MHLFKKSPSEIVIEAKEKALNAKKLFGTNNDWNTTYGLYDSINGDLSVSINCVSVIKNTNLNEDIRAEASNAVKELEKFDLDEFQSDKSIYMALKQYKVDSNETAEQKYCRERIDRDFKLQGFDLSEENFNKLKNIRKEYIDLSQDFNKNLNDDKSTISVNSDECLGLPESLVEYRNDDGTYNIPVNHSTYLQVMQSSKNYNVRERMYLSFRGRCWPQNSDILKRILQCRSLEASLLGYKNSAELGLENTMAGDVENVLKFINDIMPVAQEKAHKEHQELFTVYIDPTFLHPTTKDGNIYVSDVSFMKAEYKKLKLNVDETKLGEYFPIKSTLSKLLTMYEKILGIKITIEKTKNLWLDEMEILQVWKSGQLLGDIALDLYPRSGKYSHACCYGLKSPIYTENVNKEIGSDEFTLIEEKGFSVLLCNFGLINGCLQHREMVTLFHELGHGLHFLLGKHKLRTNNSFGVPMDFVETPSQLLEQFMWRPDVLKNLGEHYETKSQIPDELINAKIESRKNEMGSDLLTQIGFALISLNLHLLNDESLSKLNNDNFSKFQQEIRRSCDPEKILPDSDHLECSFGHLASGYSCRYYGYTWALGYAYIIYDFISENLDERGPQYADIVLSAAATRDVKESLKILGVSNNVADVFKKLLQ